MDPRVLHAHRRELEKQASIDLLHWLHANPGVVAGLGVAKAHLLSAYGHKIPVLRTAMERVGRSAAHAGLEHGLRGEKPLGHLARASMAVVDPHLKSAYEMGLSGGQAVRKQFPNISHDDALRQVRKLAKDAGPVAEPLEGVRRAAMSAVDPNLPGNRIARAMTTHVQPGKALGQRLRTFLRSE